MYQRTGDHREAFRTSVLAAGLLAVLGVLTWVSGASALFPSLGPSAYVLALRPDAEECRPDRLVGGHAIGVGAGLFSYHALAAGHVVVTDQPPLSGAALALAGAGVVSLALTVALMVWTDLRHAPACATTLIVSLGLLSTLADGLVIVAAVVVLLGTQRTLALAEHRWLYPTFRRLRNRTV
ncbi:HPP family protein [Halomarina oriensis]|uniref:HPP family protein n=1 Tax=Halomarina oriensis TaxID=671145 RepID=A0A6B0GKZ6_9EURY|nr:HPP family protein [Halomarina oriensis]MWG34407.1 HPP family protein [Halomarina oriensis]